MTSATRRPVPAALLGAALLAIGPACAGAPVPAPSDPAAARAPDSLDPIAEGYVKLVLAIGQHDPDHVDAYFGPPAWKEEAERAGKRPLAAVAAEADRLLAAARAAPAAPDDLDPSLRRAFLVGQLVAERASLARLQGVKLPFDEEARALYGVAPPREELSRYEGIQARLGALLPGDGPVPERYQAWEQRLVVPRDRIAAVVRAAIEEARRRTLARMALPAGETFALAIVTGKPWAAYNWYQGGARSLIEVNADLPFHAPYAVHLAAHEGYPGHHVSNALQEERLARGKGWVEHVAYPLFSPISLVAEGSAEAGVELVFPPEERLAFERDVLFPLGGVDPNEASRAARIRGLTKELGPARVVLARRYLDGAMSAAEVKAWLVAHGLSTPEEAAQSVEFIDRYRSYVVNYSFGKALVQGWLEARAGADPAARWAAFQDLIGSARLPEALVERPAR